MNILTVYASIFSFMAAVTHGAPLPGVTAFVDDQKFQDLVPRSHSLMRKILLSIPDVHKSSIHIKTLQLKSPENTKMVIMASNIGIPPAPVLTVVSENYTLETNLTQISEGLKMHLDLLNALRPKLDNNDKVTELSNDIRDLHLQIHKMLKLVQKTSVVQPMPKPVALRLPGEYDIQVAAHLTLVQLEAFGEEVEHCLQSMERSEDEEQDS